MITIAELRRIAAVRLEDAERLYETGQHDGAMYLCGYAVEAALKARICVTLQWEGYPETRAEFQNYQSFRTHDLDTLLHLGALESFVKDFFSAEWLAVMEWTPEARYKPIGSFNAAQARGIIDAARVLLRYL